MSAGIGMLDRRARPVRSGIATRHRKLGVFFLVVLKFSKIFFFSFFQPAPITLEIGLITAMVAIGRARSLKHGSPVHDKISSRVKLGDAIVMRRFQRQRNVVLVDLNGFVADVLQTEIAIVVNAQTVVASVQIDNCQQHFRVFCT